MMERWRPFDWSSMGWEDFMLGGTEEGCAFDVFCI